MNSLRTTSLVSLALAAAPLAVFAQGSLTPAAAPAPMMKTLAQIEARTDLNTLPGDASAMHVVTQPGSYYLTADVVGAAGKGGIRILANDVTIDLNGFTVRGPGAGSLNGVSSPDGEGEAAYSNLTVRNGSISNWGYNGIYSGHSYDFRISDVRVRNCGAAGISLSGGSNQIVDCQIENVVGTGIDLYATIGSDPIIRGCIVSGVTLPGGLARGIYAGYGTVENCRVRGISGGGATGIQVGLHTGLVSNCTVESITANAPGSRAIGIDSPVIVDCNVTGVTGGNGASATGVYGSFSGRITGTRISKVSGANAMGIYTYYSTDLSGNNGCITVQSCSVYDIEGTTGGIVGILARHVIDCTVSSVRGVSASGQATGIMTYSGGLIDRCCVTSTEGYGIELNYPSTATHNSVTAAGSDGSGAGIYVSNNACRVEGNRVSGCPIGYQQTALSALVIGNFAQGNTANYSGVWAGSIVTTYATVISGGTVMNVSF